MSDRPLRPLIRLFSRLPGLGSRSARRLVLHLLEHRESLLSPLVEELGTIEEKISLCHICGNIDVQNPCHICVDSNRDSKILCVIERVSDLWALERNPSFKGHFHVLGGVLSALDGVGPEDLRTKELMMRLADNPPEEIILALSATVNGQTTAYFLLDHIRSYNEKIKITALAHGVPIGGELDYLDDGTLTTALDARRLL